MNLLPTLLQFELAQQLRSRFLPLLLILPMIGGATLGASQSTLDPRVFPDLKRSSTPSEIIAVALPDDLAPLFGGARFEVVATSPDGFDRPPEGADIAVAWEDGTAWVRGGSISEQTANAKRVVKVLESERRFRWQASWRDTSPVDPTRVVVLHVQKERRLGLDFSPSALLAFLLCSLLGLTAYSGAAQAYTTSRQVGTRQSLDLIPARPRIIHTAKIMAVGAVAIAIGLLAVVAWLCTQFMLQDRGTSPAMLLSVPFIALLSVHLSSLWAPIAAWAPDRRTISFIGGLAMIVVFALGALTLLPDHPPLVLALLPIAGPAWMVRLALDGGSWAFMMVGIPAALAWTIAGVTLTERLWPRERGEVIKPGARQATGIYIITMLMVWFLGPAATVMHPVLGLLFLQGALIGGAAWLGPLWLGRPLLKSMSLYRTTSREMALGTMLGIGAPVIATAVALAQSSIIPLEATWADSLSTEMLGGRTLWVNLILVCAVPAVCEELLFRGTLLGLARERLGDRWSIILVALAFGLMHLDLRRLLPTTALGILFGGLTVRTGSIWPAVVAHFLNNAIVVAVLVHADSEVTVPGEMLLVAAGAVLVTWWLAGRDR